MGVAERHSSYTTVSMPHRRRSLPTIAGTIVIERETKCIDYSNIFGLMPRSGYIDSAMTYPYEPWPMLLRMLSHLLFGYLGENTGSASARRTE